MTNQLDNDLREAALSAYIEKILKTRKSERSQRIIDAIGSGGRMHATTPDGADIATISVSSPKPGQPKPVVTDMGALVRWLAEVEPQALRMSVAEWWLGSLPAWISAHEGEIPPGVSIEEPTAKEPYVSVRVSDKQAQAITDALHQSSLPPMIAGLLESGDGVD